MSARKLFESLPTHESGDFVIRVASPSELAEIMADPVLRSEGKAAMAAFLSEFKEEFPGENWIVPHLRIGGVWLVTVEAQAKADPDAPRIVAGKKTDRTNMLIAVAIVVVVGAIAVGGQL